MSRLFIFGGILLVGILPRNILLRGIFLRRDFAGRDFSVEGFFCGGILQEGVSSGGILGWRDLAPQPNLHAEFPTLMIFYRRPCTFGQSLWYTNCPINFSFFWSTNFFGHTKFFFGYTKYFFSRPNFFLVYQKN